MCNEQVYRRLEREELGEICLFSTSPNLTEKCKMYTLYRCAGPQITVMRQTGNGRLPTTPAWLLHANRKRTGREANVKLP